jgi:hypothetical protein
MMAVKGGKSGEASSLDLQQKRVNIECCSRSEPQKLAGFIEESWF